LDTRGTTIEGQTSGCVTVRDVASPIAATACLDVPAIEEARDMTLASYNFRTATSALRSGVQMSRLPRAALQSIGGETPRSRDETKHSFLFFTRLCEKACALFVYPAPGAPARIASHAKGLD
jgi:hypothetical protein